MSAFLSSAVFLFNPPLRPLVLRHEDSQPHIRGLRRGAPTLLLSPLDPRPPWWNPPSAHSGVSRAGAGGPPRRRVSPQKPKSPTSSLSPPLPPFFLSCPPRVPLMRTNMEARQRAGCLICLGQMGVGPLGVERGGTAVDMLSGFLVRNTLW